MHTAKSSIWPPPKGDYCIDCEDPVPARHYRCKECSEKYAKEHNLPDPSLDEKAERELREPIELTPNRPFQAPSGYFNTSAVIAFANIGIRRLHEIDDDLELPHNYYKHRRVYTDDERERIEKYAHRSREIVVRFSDGRMIVSTPSITQSLDGTGYSPEWFNSLGRAGKWPSFLMSGLRWHEAVKVVDYLTNQQLTEAGNQLRQGIERLCSGLGAPIISGCLLNLPQTQLGGSQNDAVVSGHENPANHRL